MRHMTQDLLKEKMMEEFFLKRGVSVSEHVAEPLEAPATVKTFSVMANSFHFSGFGSLFFELL